MDYVTLGGNIKKYRKIDGLTQEELAEKAEISPVFLSHIERATRKPSMQTIVNLADSLNVTVNDLLDNEQTKKYLESELHREFTNEQINLLHKLFDRRSEKEIAAIFDAFARLLDL